ncbi:MAG TPA: nuclear transport factor 2 family protein [Steroidobacteraceae bacterium]|jgi:predicted SnoaL-like aldol condensation-catalyzing enzyme|nr:nuclear transport factor 2 family protein [Steroidobacteraceae bacterium]
MRIFSGIALALLCGTLALSSAASADTPVTSNPKGKIAVEFLDMVFNQKKVKEGFAKYVGSYYKQHNPFAADGAQPAIDFLAPYLEKNTGYRYDFKHVYVDGDIVVVHSHVKRDDNDRGSAVVDIFRLEKGKVVEHWDVIQPIPEKSANSNTMF